MNPPAIKHSGRKVTVASGMNREDKREKPRYDLIPEGPLRDLALHYARGGKIYGDDNWRQANTEEELRGFIASMLRHAHQIAAGETDEDHVSAVVFWAFATKYLRDKLDNTMPAMLVIVDTPEGKRFRYVD